MKIPSALSNPVGMRDIFGVRSLRPVKTYLKRILAGLLSSIQAEMHAELPFTSNNHGPCNRGLLEAEM